MLTKLPSPSNQGDTGTRQPIPRVSATSHSPSKTSTPPSPGCEPVARSSSASWSRDEDSYRLCYVRGPEGIIVELARADGLTEPNANEANERESTRDG